MKTRFWPMVLGLSLTLAMGCEAFSADAGDRMRQPEFLTPVAQAQETGLELYWLGAEFMAEDAVFQISGATQLIERNGAPPGLTWFYGMRKPPGGAELMLEVQSDGAGVEAAREALKRVQGATSKSVRVGAWQGLLYSLPGGTRGP